jgi:PQQ-dependent dehydrogenase (methanol/ethanol family)
MRRRTRVLGLLVWTISAAAGVWSLDGASTRAAAQSTPVASARADWPAYGLDAAETRFSPLTEINPATIARLGLGWTSVVGEGSAPQEATPLVVDGVMYVITTWSVTAALDAATGKELWRWDPEIDRRISQSGTSRLCCGIVNRGLAIADGKVFVPTLDGRLVALDAKTGQPVWSTQATPKDDIAYSLTIAPRVAKGKVIIGNSGAEFPPYRGYVSAYDVATGREAWRFYTVPGDPSKGFENPAMAAAAKTWSGEWWKYGGGGSVWDGISYDPDANLLFVATGNGTPWPLLHREQNAGMDNLYTVSILALDPDTGTLKWHFQSTPGDQWDYDAVQQMTLATLTIGGREHRVLMQAQKNGFFYVLDRITGEFISGDPFTKVSWTTGLDPKTGRPAINPAANYATTPVVVAPSGFGAHNWSPMAYSPLTGLVYLPASLGSTFTFAAVEKFQFTPGVMNLGLNMGRRGAPPPATGTAAGSQPPAPSPLATIGPEGMGPHLVAWDPVARRERWRKPGGGAGNSGAVATAGGLVFQTLTDGRLVAYTAETGEMVFDRRVGGRGTAPPMTYAAGGKQHVAIITANPPRVQSFVLDGNAAAPPLPGPAAQPAGQVAPAGQAPAGCGGAPGTTP